MNSRELILKGMYSKRALRIPNFCANTSSPCLKYTSNLCTRPMDQRMRGKSAARGVPMKKSSVTILQRENGSKASAMLKSITSGR